MVTKQVESQNLAAKENIQKEVLAIIPARGGSKSIPRKNILPFAGHPLLSYSIAAALQANLVTRVIVSTDDPEIADVARRYDAEIPFIRPAELAQDNTLDLPVFEHALAWLAENENYHPEMVIQLRPTSPVRPVGLVDQAISLLREHPEADSARGIVPSGQNPFKMWQIGADGFIQPLLRVDGIAEPYNAPRQALPQTYWQTGHIDAIRTDCILTKKSLTGDHRLPLILDPRYTVDIDTRNDWQRAEWLVAFGGLDLVRPGPSRRSLPDKIEMVIFDFDGVMTDNRVWVDQDGREMVAAYRSDSIGINRLQKAGVLTVVLSTETNPVVTARCKKIGLPCVQSSFDKAASLSALFAEYKVNPQNSIYVGNDINDMPCFPLVGCAVVVADAQAEVLAQADLVLSHSGGHGAVREICDLVFQKNQK